jgi:PAS domain-containing protein
MPEPTMLTIISQELGIAVAILGITVSIFGASTIPAIRGWVVSIYKSISAPFSGNSRKITKLQQDYIAAGEKLDYIVEQLKPNSGSSLRDAINRLETNQLIHETKMAHYLDSKQAIMFETTAEGLYTWVSKEYENLTGRSMSELKSWGWTLSIAAEDLALVRSEWYVAVEQKRVFEKTYKVIDRKGVVVECYCRAVPTMLNDKVIAWVGILQPRGGTYGAG